MSLSLRFSLIFVFATITMLAHGQDTLTPERNARYKIDRIKNSANQAGQTDEFRSAFNALTNLAVRRTPYLTIDELRQGKADSASVVQITDVNKYGVFALDKTDTTSIDNGATVLIASGKRYKRTLLDGIVNPKMFGAVLDGNSHPLKAYFSTLKQAQVYYPFAVSLTDEMDWAACQAALDYARAQNVYTYWPAGIYRFNRTITFYHKSRIIGAGEKKVYVRSTANPIINADVTVPMTDVLIFGLNIRGSASVTNQTGIYVGVADNTAKNGGMWYSKFEALDIANLTGVAIHLNAKGTRNQFAYLHQFLEFSKLQLDYNGGSIKMEGHCNQINFRQIETTAQNVTLFDLEKVYTANFDVCTIQGLGSLGVKLNNCWNITFNTNWFEGIANGVEVIGTGNNKAKGISLLGNTFRNVEFNAFSVQEMSGGVFEGNTHFISSGTTFKPTTQINYDFGNSSDNIVIGGNHYEAAIKGPNIVNLKSNKSVVNLAGSSIAIEGAGYAEIIPAEGVLYDSLSFAPLTENRNILTIVVKRNNLHLSNSKDNFDFSGELTEVTIPVNSVVNLVLDEITNRWNLSKIPNYYRSTTEPDNYFWTAGTRVTKSYSTPHGNNEGWISIRAGISAAFWKKNAAKSLHSRVLPSANNGFYYMVTKAGSTGSIEPEWPVKIGSTVVDGSVTWTCVGVSAKWIPYGLISVPSLTAAKPFDPPRIAPNAIATTTVVVSGATMGQTAHGAFSLDLTDDMIISSRVSAANTVTVTFRNLGSAPIDLPSGRVTVRVN